jgi:bacterioferritin-associated ferredoxin
MYVCVCKAVTDRQIREAAAGGARTLKDLRRDLGVTSDCGRCAGCARDCLKDAHQGATGGTEALLQAA